MEKILQMVGVVLLVTSAFMFRLEASSQLIRRPIRDRHQTNQHLENGNRAMDAGDYQTAEAEWRKILEYDPNNANAYYNLGNLRFTQGEYEEAEQFFQHSIRLGWDDFWGRDDHSQKALAYDNLGVAQRRLDKLDEAVKSHETAIQHDPSYAPAYNNLGLVLEEQNQIDQAMEKYRMSVLIDPYYAIGHYNVGITLREQEEFEEATYYCDRVLELPETYAFEGRATEWTSVHAASHNCLGLIYRDQRQYDAAISEFEKSISLAPNWSTPKENLEETRRLLAALQAPEIPNDIDWLPQNESLLPILRSVVRVIAQIPEGASRGTGWIIKRQDRKAWIVTTHHVLTGDRGRSYNESVEIDFFSEPPPDQVHLRLPARVIQTDPSRDLALIEVSDLPGDIESLEISTELPSRQADVWIIGHPINGIPWTVEAGKISNRDQEQLQISQATMAAGNSGGPVLDQETNKVVGIVVDVQFCERAQDCTSGFGFAIPVASVLNQLRSWDMIRPRSVISFPSSS